MSTNHLGIQADKVQELSKQLNRLLSSYQLHYQNLRGLHWNIKGKDFFELHVKYEEYYTDAQVKIDEVAERILTLGGAPLHSYQSYIDNSIISSKTNVSSGADGVKIIAESVQKLLEIEKEILALASDVSDEGTVDLMTQFISQQEKELWMLRSWLNI